MIPLPPLFLFMFWLQFKHFVFDFCAQPAWMYNSKGTYFAAGGIVHSLIHAFITFVIIGAYKFPIEVAGIVALVEFLAHYHIDWAKMNINRLMRWYPNTSENFWRLLGFDQFLHQLTYLWIVWYILRL